jgi:hypothetical protein
MIPKRIPEKIMLKDKLKRNAQTAQSRGSTDKVRPRSRTNEPGPLMQAGVRPALAPKKDCR